MLMMVMIRLNTFNRISNLKTESNPIQALMKAKCCSRLSRCPLATIWRIRSGSIIADRKLAVISRSFLYNVQ